MAIFNKLSDLAKNVGDKAGGAIETTKLNSKISAEQNAIGAVMKQIGEFYYNKYAETGKADKNIADFCATIDKHNEVIAEAKAEIARINAASAPPGSMVCTACGKIGAPDKKFCAECGGKLEAPPPPAAKSGFVCTSCGKTNAEGKNFCTECGGKIEAEKKDDEETPSAKKTKAKEEKLNESE